MGITTSFVGVDADAIGTGGTTDTLTIDTWLQRRIQYNNQALLAPRVGICWSPISGSCGTWTSYTGIRPYCSLEWHTVWYGVVQTHRDQTHLSITLAYQADTPGNSTQAGTVEIRVSCGDGTDTRTSPATLASTYSSGVKTGHQTITVELAERVRSNGLMLVIIWARSRVTTDVATTIGDSGTGVTAAMYHEHPFRLRDSDGAGDGFFDPNSTGTPPDGDSLEAMYILGSTHTTWPDASGQKYDLVYSADAGAQGTIAGTVQTVATDASQTAVGATAQMHICLMLRAIYFEPVFGSTTAAYAPSAIVPPARFAPIIEFGSSEAMIQAAAVRRAYFQPTVALIGPRGKWGDTSFANADMDSFAANGYAAHWPFVMGDYTDSINGDHTDLINEGLWLRTENPTIEIRCAWLSVQHGAQFDANQTATGLEKGNKRVGQKQGVTTSGGAGLANWTMTASLHQLDDAAATGDWDTDITEYGSLTETVGIPVYGADVVNARDDQPPVLRGVDSMEQTAKSASLGAGFWFREGSLFEPDVAAGLLKETSHLIRLSGLTETETLKPFRLKLNMDLADFVDPVKVGAGSGLPSQLRLMLVSFTVLEHPEEP